MPTVYTSTTCVRGNLPRAAACNWLSRALRCARRSLLHAWLGKKNLPVEWRVTPDNRQFACDVLISGQLTGRGSANSKQKAK